MSFGATTPQGVSGNLANSNFPAGFANGVSIQGVPILNTYGGRVWWVDSVNGADGNKGTFARPFATVARALAVLASPGSINGDIVMVKDGHQESIATAAGWAVAANGLQIIGLGVGRRRPRITFDTATTATILVTGAGVRISNIDFTCNIANLVTMIDVRGTDLTVDTCNFREGTGSGQTYIDTTAAAANAADRLKVYNNRFTTGATGNYTAAVLIGSLVDFHEQAGNWARGFFSQGVAWCPTGFNGSQWSVVGNTYHNLNTANRAIRITSTCTGLIYGNYFSSATLTQTPGSYGSMVDVGDNVSSHGDMNAGAPFVFAASLVSSGITVAVQTLGTVGVGPIYIDNVILRTGATGLAAGTNFNLSTNDTTGLSIFFSETVANLGANKTIDMFTTSLVKQRTVISTGSTVRYGCTGVDCTGAGTLSVMIVGRRVNNGAVLFA